MASPPSSAVRFLGLTNQPDSGPNPTSFELDESDVVWSSDLSDSGDLRSTSPLTFPSSPVRLLHHDLGLSAALSDDDDGAVLRRKPALDPSLSAASAARTIPPARRSSGPASATFRPSPPVNMPVWPRKAGQFGVNSLGSFEGVDEDERAEEEKEMVPPHVIVARSHVTTFSVLEGVGRTLKGRDLRRVRNAVFQKTGFID